MRTIMLFLDWDSTLFWHDEEGTDRINEATLPISDALKKRLDEYYRHYSELYYQDDRGPVPGLDKRLLDDTGLEIWRQLRAELGHIYRIIYYSLEFSDSFESPEEFLVMRKQVST